MSYVAASVYGMSCSQFGLLLLWGVVASSGTNSQDAQQQVEREKEQREAEADREQVEREGGSETLQKVRTRVSCCLITIVVMMMVILPPPLVTIITLLLLYLP